MCPRPDVPTARCAHICPHIGPCSKHIAPWAHRAVGTSSHHGPMCPRPDVPTYAHISDPAESCRAERGASWLELCRVHEALVPLIVLRVRPTVTKPQDAGGVMPHDDQRR
ncbi:hypothetical protein ACOMHN_022309 [Nucella lapillus]